MIYVLLAVYFIVLAAAWQASSNQKAPFWINAAVAFGWPLWVVLAFIGACTRGDDV